MAAAEKSNKFHFLYDEKDSIKNKIGTIAREIYGADDVIFAPKASKEIKKLEELGLDKHPICMAKTQYSLSDDPSLLGRPTGFKITVKEVRVSAGAGFIVALTGDVMIMPGLPKVPSAEKIDIDENGVISGIVHKLIRDVRLHFFSDLTIRVYLLNLTKVFFYGSRAHPTK